MLNHIPFLYLGEMLDTSGCIDFPGFEDKWKTNCTETGKHGNCKDGKAAKVDEAQLRRDANDEGISVMDACCVCGGGTKGS